MVGVQGKGFNLKGSSALGVGGAGSGGDGVTKGAVSGSCRPVGGADRSGNGRASSGCGGPEDLASLEGLVAVIVAQPTDLGAYGMNDVAEPLRDCRSEITMGCPDPRIAFLH